MTTQKAETKRLLREQILKVWGSGKIKLVDTNYAIEITDHMPVPGQPSGREALKDVVHQFRAGIPDMEMDLRVTLAAGDFGVDVWTLKGTHGGVLLGKPATGRALEISGIDMIRTANGQITDLWHVEEMAVLIAQMDESPLEFGAPAAPVANESWPQQSEVSPGANAIVPGEAGFSALEKRNLAIARRHIEEIWAGGNAELCWEMYHPGVVDHNMAPDQKPGIEGIVDVLQWLRESVLDLAMQIECYVIDGDMFADRWIMQGTHTGAPLMGVPARGKSFTINGMDVGRIDEDGLITDIWHAEEFHQLLHQVS